MRAALFHLVLFVGIVGPSYLRKIQYDGSWL
jgi:hypothetical protein